MTTLPLILAYVFSGNIANLLFAFIGLVLVVCIVFFIMRKAGAPEWAYTVFYVVIGIIALLVVIDVFFGGGHLSAGSGNVYLR
jgi:hypothetical protein